AVRDLPADTCRRDFYSPAVESVGGFALVVALEAADGLQPAAAQCDADLRTLHSLAEDVAGGDRGGRFQCFAEIVRLRIRPLLESRSAARIGFARKQELVEAFAATECVGSLEDF